jgi:hypothetical protein
VFAAPRFEVLYPPAQIGPCRSRKGQERQCRYNIPKIDGPIEVNCILPCGLGFLSR